MISVRDGSHRRVDIAKQPGASVRGEGGGRRTSGRYDYVHSRPTADGKRFLRHLARARGKSMVLCEYIEELSRRRPDRASEVQQLGKTPGRSCRRRPDSTSPFKTKAGGRTAARAGGRNAMQRVRYPSRTAAQVQGLRRQALIVFVYSVSAFTGKRPGQPKKLWTAERRGLFCGIVFPVGAPSHGAFFIADTHIAGRAGVFRRTALPCLAPGSRAFSSIGRQHLVDGLEARALRNSTRHGTEFGRTRGGVSLRYTGTGREAVRGLGAEPGGGVPTGAGAGAGAGSGPPGGVDERAGEGRE